MEDGGYRTYFLRESNEAKVHELAARVGCKYDKLLGNVYSITLKTSDLAHFSGYSSSEFFESPLLYDGTTPMSVPNSYSCDGEHHVGTRYLAKNALFYHKIGTNFDLCVDCFARKNPVRELYEIRTNN